MRPKTIAIIAVSFLAVLFSVTAITNKLGIFVCVILLMDFFIVLANRDKFLHCLLTTIFSILLVITAGIGLSVINSFVRPPVVEARAPIVEAQEVVAEPVSKNIDNCSYSYPDSITPWCGLIEKAAQDYDLDPLLIASVMIQESGGQSDVISQSGAVGLLQVMPRDGIAASFMCANGPCFSKRPSTDELLDPAYNVDYGSRMLANLIKKNSGSVRDALKSYGPYDVGYYYADKVLAIREGL